MKGERRKMDRFYRKKDGWMGKLMKIDGLLGLEGNLTRLSTNLESV